MREPSLRIDAPPAPVLEECAELLARLNPGRTRPLNLFVALAHNSQALHLFCSLSSYVYGRIKLSPRHREIIILCVTANCRGDYEWDVHANHVAPNVGLTASQILDTKLRSHSFSDWTRDELLILRLCDQLSTSFDITDDLWLEISGKWPTEILVEMITLCGLYCMASMIGNALRIRLEDVNPKPTPQT